MVHHCVFISLTYSVSNLGTCSPWECRVSELSAPFFSAAYVSGREGGGEQPKCGQLCKHTQQQ